MKFEVYLAKPFVILTSLKYPAGGFAPSNREPNLNLEKGAVTAEV